MSAGLPTEGGYIRVSSNTSTPALILKGSTSGTTTLNAPAAAGSAVATFPVGTGTIAVLTSTGTFVATGASAVTVTDAEVTANSQILITLKTVGGTVGAIPHVETITVGTGFTVVGTASDTSTYNYAIIG